MTCGTVLAIPVLDTMNDAMKGYDSGLDLVFAYLPKRLLLPGSANTGALYVGLNAMSLMKVLLQIT